MYKEFKLKAPFFEVGPKVYLYGESAVELAKYADSVSEKYGVDIIFTAQYTDIYTIASQVKNIFVFAQHMDAIEPGRGVGAVLPEALKAAGAVGVMLNHVEKPLTLAMINRSIKRADEVGLATMVCADTPEEAASIAQLGPNIVLAESPSLIGVGKRSAEDAAQLRKTNETVRSINPLIRVLHGAGIKDEKDVFNVITDGADATGSTSGILKAEDPFSMLDRMIASVRCAWDERHDVLNI
ncbi:MAG TPA: triose-phosphate isomerase [Firmicutes bacterium]|jgi:triosephosphate isomerase (TIM)|nr:triose-phosphate isomerase [Bacillota bacterium]